MFPGSPLWPQKDFGLDLCAYQGFVLDLLADELVLTQGIAGLSSDGVDGPLLHLLLDGAVQHEERLAGTLLLGQSTESHVTQPPSTSAKSSESENILENNV